MQGFLLMVQIGGMILDAFGLRSPMVAFFSGLLFLILFFYGLSRFSQRS